MGFSVTAASVIFGIAMIASLSAASSVYWQTATHLEESRRVAEERTLDAVRTTMTITNYVWNNGPKTVEFTITNEGTSALDFTSFNYLFSGTITFAAQEANYPKLNGASPPNSNLLLPGETLDCRFSQISEPTAIQVVAANGAIAHYPG